MILATAFLFSTSISNIQPRDLSKDIPQPTLEGLPRRGALGVSFAPLSAEQTTKLGLKPGAGVVVTKPVPGLTADKAGLKDGDVMLTLNDKTISLPTIGAMVREIPAGTKMVFKVIRAGKPTELSATLVERPRDPGNANFEVIYSDVVSNGKRMRTIITKPRKPGKYPGFMFIQGFSPVSYDYVLDGPADLTRIDAPILFDFANGGFVTIRVEKPGVGDSEGGPFADLDYTTELDIYRQALKQLKAQSGLDTDNVFIFGHSMGGAFGPMIANEIPVKGIATYGTAARTWYEYFLDIIRYQGLLAGMSFEAADDSVRQGAQAMALIFMEGKSPADVKKSHPHLAGFVDGYFPGGMFNQKTSDFWRQLANTNFSKYWANANARVFAIHGASDFVSYEVDHKVIADAVNAVHPGWGKNITLPNSDHLFNTYPTEAESHKNWPRGTFNNDISKVLKAWIAEVMAAKG